MGLLRLEVRQWPFPRRSGDHIPLLVSRGSARLEAGKSVRWDWEMYGFSVDAQVKALEPNARLVVEWTPYGHPTDITWVFTARPDGTVVSVTNTGFQGSLAGATTLAVQVWRPWSVPDV
jgi:uncharacterized protein YndB with AHSA1/START domain